MEVETQQAAALAYNSYRAYAKGKHPVTGTALPKYDDLDWRARAAWANVAVALKVHFSK